MLAKVLQFCTGVLKQAWRIGLSRAKRVVSWAKNNYKKVYGWIISGVAWDTILGWIIDVVG